MATMPLVGSSWTVGAPSGWDVTYAEWGSEVTPTGDIIEHTSSGECVCDPEWEPVGEHWMLTHNAADGRI
jgi:hypothetical protein